MPAPPEIQAPGHESDVGHVSRRRPVDHELIASFTFAAESGRLVEAREHATGLRFDVVASVRVDTIFTREVPAPVFAFASKSPVAKIFVPHLGARSTATWC